MICKLIVENFLSIEDIYLDDMEKMDTIGILGQYENKVGYSNGSGKSSLAESIWYAFTGNHRYKRDLDVIRIGSSEAHIYLNYINNEEEVIIERFIKVKNNRDGEPTGTKTSALVKYNDEIVASGTREAQLWINKYFGITEDGFLKSFFFRQKEYDILMKARSGERLKFIEDFLGASIFDKAKKLSSKKRNEIDIEIKGIDSQIEILNEKLLTSDELKKKKILLTNRQLELDDFNKQLEQLEIDKEDCIKEIAEKEAKLKTIDDKIFEKQKIEKQLNDIKKKGKQLQKKKEDNEKFIESSKLAIKTLNDQLGQIEVEDLPEDIYDKIDTLKNKREKLLISIASQEEVIKQIEEGRKHIDIGDCPICFRPVDEKLMKSLKYKYDSKIKIANEEIKNRNEGLQHIDVSISKMEKSIKEKEKADRSIEKLKQKIKVKETELNGDERVLDAFKEQLKVLKNQFNDLQKKYKRLNDFLNDDDNNTNILESHSKKDKVEKDIKKTKGEIQIICDTIASLEVIIKNNAQVKADIANLSKKRKSKANEITCRIKLDSVFDKCRMEIITTGLEELENDSTDIISNLGATQKQIVWRTQKESLTGNVKDSLDIYLIDEKGERLIEGLSGGEWDLAAFSTRAALAKYKLSRMNSKIDFMILDEIFGALDENSQEELISVINMFKEEFSQVFVISHTNLKESFGHNIKVEMGNDGITKLV